MGSHLRAFGMARLGAQQRTEAYKQDVFQTTQALRSASTERPALAGSDSRLPAPISLAELYLQDTGERVREKNGEKEINICFKNSSGVAKRNLKILSSKAAVSEAARSDGCLR